MHFVPLLGLPFTFVLGWYLGIRESGKSKIDRRSNLSKQYFVGLNYLLSEQQDKAVDVFIKMLEVDGDTVETHLALGSIFRRRGEVDRAIRIHQNLIARPQLSKLQRIHSLLELGQDYMRAGVLDRAERLFMEVVDSGEQQEHGLRYLLDIYEQEKDWHRAIEVAQRLETKANQSMRVETAHYYCELAESSRQQAMLEKANAYLKRALLIDRHCVRASLIQAKFQYQAGRYKSAIRIYQRAIKQDPDYLSEAIEPMGKCYAQLQDLTSFVDYLQTCLVDNPRISIAIALADLLSQRDGEQAARDCIANHLRQYPSIRGLQYLIELQLKFTPTGVIRKPARDNLMILQDITKKLLRDKPIYRCYQCGFAGTALHWQCPGCKQWNTTKPIHGLEGD